jgi:hypothetical protein
MSFEQILVHCSAPALCGIKPSCLFSMEKERCEAKLDKIREWNSEFSEAGICIVPVPRFCGIVLFFVYDRELLVRQCEGVCEKDYLLRKGYPVYAGFKAMLAELLHRLSCGKEFPHEVGVFLGYPLEDVIAFEQYAGSGYAYSGYWKTYGNVSAARMQAARYRDCSVACGEWLMKGYSVPAAAKRFRASYVVHSACSKQ